ncbi:RHS repeat protein [Nocardia sp. 2]|uniref:RHS repeat protein n=1 Tax=Nocardia acididurans TaxID=2802282 RepID=A0ABS1MEZ9_9NOCA|nr:RHS repeat-associated core domain-containing protein [Nocardia acididurans]MBL1079202.1 RHS repeat protein [Nocardia acididurans]
MGIGDWLSDKANAAGEWLEDTAESVTAKIGETADSGLDGLSSLARRIGADGVAEALDDFGDEIASITGGEVQERDLGETKDPKELIRGEPSAIHDVAGKLKNLATSIESTGTALRTINVADWTGEAATAFHTEFEKQPQLWFTAADAMTNCAATLDGWWYWVVVAAQAKAQNAIDKWEEAERAEAAYNALSDDAKKTATRTDGTLRDEARTILNDARSQRDSAAAGVVAAIQGYTESAPTEPPFTSRWSDNFTDLAGIADHAQLSFISGLTTSLTGIVQFVRAVNPTDTYNMTHPAEYLTNMSNLGTGLVVAAADPGAMVNGFLSGARKNPFEFAGALTGDALLTVATGGAGGAAKVTVQTVDKVTDAVKTTERIADAVDNVPVSPAGKGLPHGEGPATTTGPSTADNLVQNPVAHPESPNVSSAAETHTSSADNSGAQPPESGKPVADNPAPAQPDSPSNAASSDQPGTQPNPAADAPANGSPAAYGESTDGRPGPDVHDPGTGRPNANAGDDVSAGGGDPDAIRPTSNDGAGQPVHDGGQQPGPGRQELADADNGLANDGATSPDSNRTPHEVTESPDPVDIATGEFLLPQTDVDLPGVLALVLKRRHRSNYRFGRWFGPSWSATLDMRVVVEEESVTLVGEDGVVLVYPHAEVGVAVPPVTGGQRWTMTRTDVGGYRVSDPDHELTWHFAPEPDLGGLDARLGNFAISAITDRHHNRVRFQFDEDGAPVSVTHSGGYRVEVSTSGGRVVGLAVVDTSQNSGATRILVREFAYRVGNLAAVTNAVGATTHYTYDDHARMLSWTDSNGTTMVNTYDDAGRVVRQRGTGGILDTDFNYVTFPDGTGTLTTLTDSLGGTTTHGFDHDLRLRDRVDPLGGRTHLDYNVDRKPLSVVAPDGAVTRYLYTGDGDIAQITRPDGATIDVEYDSRRRPLAVTDVDGSIRRQDWDANGNLVAAIDSDGVRTEYGYHASGATATVLAPTGARTVIEVDAAGLPVAVTDSYGAVTRIERDCFGRPVRVVDALEEVTRYSWAASGKLLRRTDPDGFAESWSWDGEGNLLVHTDRAGGTTRFTYGPFDLLESRVDPDGSATRYAWDTDRRLTEVTNPLGQIWKYEYDAAGRLVAETDYSGARAVFTHDRAGRVTSITSAGGIRRRHTRDLLGRVTEVAADTGEWLRYRHDIRGRVLSAVSGSGDDATHTLEFAYAPNGQLLSQQLDSQPALRHEYDEYGRRIRRTLPSGAVTTWEWNDTNRVIGMVADDHRFDFRYDRKGRQTGWRLDEIVLSRTLSALGRLTGQNVTGFPATSLALEPELPDRPGPHTIRQDDYVYRPDGYLTGHTLLRAHDPQEHRQFTIDTLGRVATISRNGTLTESYRYDALSNVTEARPEASGDGSREYQGNLLVRRGRTSYRYDADGRLTQKVTKRLSRKPEVWQYHYNAFNQLTAVRTPDGQSWRYTYDALGRRVAKHLLEADGQISDRVDYTWDGVHLAEETHGGTRTRWHNEPGTHTPLAQTTDQSAIDREFFAIVTDLIGSPVELVDPVNAVSVGTASTDLWGRTSWAGTASTPLRFPGQIEDPETGLHYNQYRYYDPETGRYNSSDPLGLEASGNPFGYVTNPLVWSDPLGLCPADTTRGAPKFVVDSSGEAVIRDPGRPDGDLVFSGHGTIGHGDLAEVTVPPGTSVNMYSPHSDTISDALGNRIETDNPKPVATFNPGDKIPDYYLLPPTAPMTPLNIMGSPVTVTGPTRLSELLRSNMGSTHWAACREVVSPADMALILSLF